MRYVEQLSHDLQTPVTAIRHLAETLCTDLEYQPDPLPRERAGRIVDRAHELGALIEDLLWLFKLEDGDGLPVWRRRLRVSQLVSGSWAVVSSRAASRQLRVTVQDASRGDTFADEDQLRRLLEIAIEQAVKTAACGTNVQIEVRSGADVHELSVEYAVELTEGGVHCSREAELTASGSALQQRLAAELARINLVEMETLALENQRSRLRMRLAPARPWQLLQRLLDCADEHDATWEVVAVEIPPQAVAAHPVVDQFLQAALPFPSLVWPCGEHVWQAWCAMLPGRAAVRTCLETQYTRFSADFPPNVLPPLHIRHVDGCRLPADRERLLSHAARLARP